MLVKSYELFKCNLKLELLYKRGIKMLNAAPGFETSDLTMVSAYFLSFLLITIFKCSEQYGNWIKMLRVNLQKTVSYKETRSSTKLNSRRVYRDFFKVQSTGKVYAWWGDSQPAVLWYNCSLNIPIVNTLLPFPWKSICYLNPCIYKIVAFLFLTNFCNKFLPLPSHQREGQKGKNMMEGLEWLMLSY